MVLRDMELHILAVHVISAQGSKIKTAPLEHPSIREGVTEGEWICFVSQWEHYKRRIVIRATYSRQVMGVYGNIVRKIGQK